MCSGRFLVSRWYPGRFVVSRVLCGVTGAFWVSRSILGVPGASSCPGCFPVVFLDVPGGFLMSRVSFGVPRVCDTAGASWCARALLAVPGPSLFPVPLLCPGCFLVALCHVPGAFLCPGSTLFCVPGVFPVLGTLCYPGVVFLCPGRLVGVLGAW